MVHGSMRNNFDIRSLPKRYPTHVPPCRNPLQAAPPPALSADLAAEGAHRHPDEGLHALLHSAEQRPAQEVVVRSQGQR